MTDDKQDASAFSQELRSMMLTPDGDAPEMVLVHLDADVVERLKLAYGAEWKAKAAELLKKSQP